MITSNELRQKYLSFFKEKKHSIIESSSLIPENDPTVLFTTAGMHPLVPFLLGESHPGGKRLANVQKCIRTDDIEEVGDSTHHTFFEMLGNWSLGDYFKKESLEFSWEFLIDQKYLGLDKNRLACSVFAGDQDAPFDQKSFEIWQKIGMPEEKIAKLPKKNNWWGPAGQTGPCGPDSEIFYWVGHTKKIPASFNDDNNLWVEIWNNVFMQYNKNKKGEYEPLTQKNIDTGMGLERVLAIINGLDDNYKTDLFWPIILKIEVLSDKKYQEYQKEFRIIADHLKAATMILADERGIIPLNVGQGYVVRRLIRRAIRYGKMIGIKDNFTDKLAQVVIEIYKDVYLEVKKNKDFVIEQLKKEEDKFKKTLDKGLKEVEKLKNIDGKMAFDLYQTYGFPLEMTEELAREKKLVINKTDFEEEFKKHQELSRTASSGLFKGGLADSGEKSVKYHTATHLLHQALRIVLGEHVAQKGSNINAERLRFDFSHPEKMTSEQLKKVENIVNEQIIKALPVTMEMMSLDLAKQNGAIGLFASKYGEQVKVYTIGDNNSYFSREICGGPHVKNTSELGVFKIIKEEASSAGVRRIKAILEG